ncbi:hypothetical protein RDT67_13255 [Serratia fonticola]|uniref:Uncharacterized protein n=1 Tax=Serratia fonticola TaxID=47917 RepID=A0AAJ1YB96_SERFO|nr:hypothetical protein [Serratia fonticola]MDQ9127401.1 hypothetical protein [Serratia fonticola]
MQDHGISQAADSLTFLMKLSSVDGSGAKGGMGWVNNRRVVFWVWLYLRNANYVKLGVFENKESPGGTFYNENKFIEYPDSHEKRRIAIYRWFSAFKLKYGFKKAQLVAEGMSIQWLKIYESIAPPYKISETSADSAWAWKYIKKSKSFELSNLLSLNPRTHSERIHFINAVFDITLIESDFCLDLEVKDRLFNKMEMAFYKQRSRRMGNEKEKKKINVAVTPETKEMLEEISTLEGRTFTVIIERLISERYKQLFHNKNPAGSKW